MIKQTLSFPKDMYQKNSVILKFILTFKHFYKSHVLVTALNVKHVLKKHFLVPCTSSRDQIIDTKTSFFPYTAQVQPKLGPAHAQLGRQYLGVNI